MDIPFVILCSVAILWPIYQVCLNWGRRDHKKLLEQTMEMDNEILEMKDKLRKLDYLSKTKVIERKHLQWKAKEKLYQN
jgi:hypothetical protein